MKDEYEDEEMRNNEYVFYWVLFLIFSYFFNFFNFFFHLFNLENDLWVF